MRFRKKPVEIEAFQWAPGLTLADLPDWAIKHMVYSLSGGGLLIKTLEGDMRADRGDWIIRGVKGEVYPCKPDIFHATYEAVQP